MFNIAQSCRTLLVQSFMNTVVAPRDRSQQTKRPLNISVTLKGSRFPLINTYIYGTLYLPITRTELPPMGCLFGLAVRWLQISRRSAPKGLCNDQLLELLGMLASLAFQSFWPNPSLFPIGGGMAVLIEPSHVDRILRELPAETKEKICEAGQG